MLLQFIRTDPPELWGGTDAQLPPRRVALAFVPVPRAELRAPCCWDPWAAVGREALRQELEGHEVGAE